MKNRLYLILTIPFLTSCCLTAKDRYRYVEKEYYPIYEKGDTLFYESNWNNKDTFVCSGITHNFDDCDSNEDFCETLVCYERLFFSYKSINPNSSKLILAEHQGAYGHYSFNGFFGGYNNYSDTSIIVDGEIYSAYFREVQEYMTTEIEYAYYSYKYGIIQYAEKSGEIWSLKKRN